MGDVEPGADDPAAAAGRRPVLPASRPGHRRALHAVRSGDLQRLHAVRPRSATSARSASARRRAEFRRGPGRRDAVAKAKGVSGIDDPAGAPGVGLRLEPREGRRRRPRLRAGRRSACSQAGGGFGYPRRAAGSVGLAAGQYWRLVSPMFLHFGIFHLAVNAYSLCILGGSSRSVFGRWRLIAPLPRHRALRVGVELRAATPTPWPPARRAPFSACSAWCSCTRYQLRGSALGRDADADGRAGPADERGDHVRLAGHRLARAPRRVRRPAIVGGYLAERGRGQAVDERDRHRRRRRRRASWSRSRRTPR